MASSTRTVQGLVCSFLPYCHQITVCVQRKASNIVLWISNAAAEHSFDLKAYNAAACVLWYTGVGARAEALLLLACSNSRVFLATPAVLGSS
jgi:hypothetical protein